LEEEIPRRVNPPGKTVMKKYLIAGLLVAGLVTPAFAAASYYVAQNNSTHKCSIVSKKPDGKTLSMLGTDSFKTKSAAEVALKGMTEQGVSLKPTPGADARVRPSGRSKKPPQSPADRDVLKGFEAVLLISSDRWIAVSGGSNCQFGDASLAAGNSR
jgi:hypothetical protein